MKADFVRDLHQALVEIEAAKQVFNDCFDNKGNLVAEGIEKIMQDHWPYFMNGTYGVCLKEMSAKNIILKNIAVTILEKWVNTPHHHSQLYEVTFKAAELYDKVAACFGPHEAHKSTRDRLFYMFLMTDPRRKKYDESSIK